MTPRDWELLSEWVDGALGGEERVAFERRLANEPELASAARQLRALSSAAAGLAPSAEDTLAAGKVSTSPHAWGVTGLVVLLGVVVGSAVLFNHSAPTASQPVTTAPARLSMEPSQPLPHVIGSHDAGDSMTRSLDASVLAPLAAILVATAAGPSGAEAPLPAAANPGDAGTGKKPIVLAIGGKLRLEVPVSTVRAVPTGLVELIKWGEWTTVEGRTAGLVLLELTGVDGGVGERIEVRVEPFVSPEEPQLVGLGETFSVLTPGRIRWSIGDRTVARVTESTSELKVRGERGGSTTLNVWFEDGTSRRWPVQVDPDAHVIRLGVGKLMLLNIPVMKSYSVTPAGIVNVTKRNDKLVYIKAVREGLATLEVEQPGGAPARYRLFVTAHHPLDLDNTHRGVQVPVVVAATDIPENTVVTLEMISQRSLAAHLVTPSQVKPDSSMSIVNRRILVPLKTGESVLWSHFGMTSPATLGE